MSSTQIILSLVGVVAWSLLMFFLGVKQGKEDAEFDQQVRELVDGKNRPQL